MSHSNSFLVLVVVVTIAPCVFSNAIDGGYNGILARNNRWRSVIFFAFSKTYLGRVHGRL
jgi:hypothetical protein